MNSLLKKTPLVEEHVALGAKMVDFGGWYMPVQYSGLMDEHVATRNFAGLFDVSHMGEIRVKGKDSEHFIDVLTTNAVSSLIDGQIHYTVMLNENGTVIDDLLVYRFNTENYLLVVNASNLEKDFNWIVGQASTFEVDVSNESDDTAQIAVQGPQAEKILQKITMVPLDGIPYYHFTEGKVMELDCLISRTGYTGEDGFELYMARQDAASIWRKLIEAGEAFGLKPAGLGARDTLRLEARMALYGHELGEDITPLEAGLKWVVKLRKKADFVGKQALKMQRKAGVEKKIVGFEMTGKGIPRQGYPVLVHGEQVGLVASGTFSPTLQHGIGTAFVSPECALPETEIVIQVRKKMFNAVIVKGPFYQRPKS